MAVLNEALADELQRQGVTRVFTLLGEDVVQLGVCLTQRGIELVSSRHESGAIAMADGYARVSGELAVALISRGPGVTNALTGLANAAKASNPVLVITGDNAPTTRGVIYSKWLDQTALFKAAEIPFVTIDSPESAVADLAAVTEWVRGGKLMVAQLPGEILEATAGQAPASITLPPPRPVPGPPDPEQITLLADLLGEDWAFAHPIILGGRGAHRAGAKHALQQLGDRIGAILATTLMGKGLYDDDPFSVGISGTYSSEAAIESARHGRRRARLRQLARSADDDQRLAVVQGAGVPLRRRPRPGRSGLGARRDLRAGRRPARRRGARRRA